MSQAQEQHEPLLSSQSPVITLEAKRRAEKFSLPTLLDQMNAEQFTPGWRIGILTQVVEELEQGGMDSLLEKHPPTTGEQMRFAELAKDNAVEDVTRATVLDTALDLAGSFKSKKNQDLIDRAFAIAFKDASGVGEEDKWPDQGLAHRFLIHSKYFGRAQHLDNPNQKPAYTRVIRHLAPEAASYIVTDIMTLDMFRDTAQPPLKDASPILMHKWYYTTKAELADRQKESLLSLHVQTLSRNDALIDLAVRESTPHMQEMIHQVNERMHDLVRWADEQFSSREYNNEANRLFETTVRHWGERLAIYGSIYPQDVSTWTREWWDEYHDRPGKTLDRPAVFFALLNIADPDQANGPEGQMQNHTLAESVLQLLSHQEYTSHLEGILRQSVDDDVPAVAHERLTRISSGLLDDLKLDHERTFQAMRGIFLVDPTAITGGIRGSREFQTGYNDQQKRDFLRYMFEQADQAWWTGELDRDTETPNEAIVDVFKLVGELNIETATLWDKANNEAQDALLRLEKI